MIKAKIDKTKVYEKDGKYYFHSEYLSEMDEEEYNKIIQNFKNQIKQRDKIIEEHNPEKAVKKEIERLTNQHKANKEALKNYDKYVEEEIDKIRKKKEESKKQLQESVDNYLKVKDFFVERIKQQKQQLVNNQKFMQEKDKELLQVYEQKGVKDYVKEKQSEDKKESKE